MKMKKKFQFSMIVLTMLVVAFSFSFTKVQAASAIPKIQFVGVDHSPLVEGDTESFYITSDYDGQVQYQILMNKIGTNKWTDITEGYLEAIDAKKPYEFSYMVPFELGKYKLSVRVKKANTAGTKSDVYGKYDSKYDLQLSCVKKDDNNRVYLSDDMKVAKDNYKTGEKVVVRGVNNISGMKGPYTYKLHYYDCNEGTWHISEAQYGNKLEWTPTKPGIYVLDIWAMSSNSTLLPKIKANPKKALYEGWKLKVITVTEDKTFELKKEFFNNLAKSYDIKSLENQTKININVDVAGLSEEDLTGLKDILPLLKNISLDVNTKSVTNKSSVAKSQIDMKLNAAGMEIPVSIWSDMDLTGKNPKNTAIIEIPSILSNFLPELKDKKYLVIDSFNNESINMSGVNSEKLTNMIQIYTPMINEFMIKYLQQYNPPVDFIKDLGNKDITTVDGKTVSAKGYELKITNENIKEIVNYTVENLLNNEDAMKLFKDYMLSTIEAMDEVDSEEAKQSMDEIFNELEAIEMPEVMQSISDAMDMIAELKLLGDNGITIEYYMNSNGHVISTKGTIEFVIDLAKFDPTLAEMENATNPIIKLNINFTSNIFNINENIDIKLPEINKENSIDYMKLIMDSINQSVENNIIEP